MNEHQQELIDLAQQAREEGLDGTAEYLEEKAETPPTAGQMEGILDAMESEVE